MFALLLSARINLNGATFVDDFANGLRTNLWVVSANTSRYELEGSKGQVTLTGRAGGSRAYVQNVQLWSQIKVYGDFDVRVDYRDAHLTRINGSPGNQVELNCRIDGGGIFFVSRSDEAGQGQQVHVWTGSFHGPRATDSADGTLRIVRLGRVISGYWNTHLLYEGIFQTNAVTFSLRLQNNGTSDPISVSFDNFSVEAQGLVFGDTPVSLSLDRLGADRFVLSWPAWATNYVLESSSAVESPGSQGLVWKTEILPTSSDEDAIRATNRFDGPTRIFRLRQ